MHFLLFYDVVADYIEKRAPIRKDHFALAQKAVDAGEMVMAGALADPVDGAVFVFRGAEAAQHFAESDPYVQNGLVTSWRVRKWTTVIGDGAVLPSL